MHLFTAGLERRVFEREEEEVKGSILGAGLGAESGAQKSFGGS